jgi:hypothetical protein
MTPSSIKLKYPFENTPLTNLSLDTVYKIDCIIGISKPRPTFTWFIGDEKLDTPESTETKENFWINSLTYTPLSNHANQTLLCVADHIALQDSLNASIVIELPDDFASPDRIELGVFHSLDGREVMTILVSVFSVVGGVCLIIGALWKAKICDR